MTRARKTAVSGGDEAKTKLLAWVTPRLVESAEVEVTLHLIVHSKRSGTQTVDHFVHEVGGSPIDGLVAQIIEVAESDASELSGKVIYSVHLGELAERCTFSLDVEDEEDDGPDYPIDRKAPETVADALMLLVQKYERDDMERVEAASDRRQAEKERHDQLGRIIDTAQKCLPLLLEKSSPQPETKVDETTLEDVDAFFSFVVTKIPSEVFSDLVGTLDPDTLSRFARLHTGWAKRSEAKRAASGEAPNGSHAPRPKGSSGAEAAPET